MARSEASGPRRWLRNGAIAVAVLVAAALIALWAWADPMAKDAIEDAGTSATGVATTLDAVSLELFTGGLSFGGLAIDNPEGFPSEHFLELESGDVDVELLSLLGDRIEIPDIELRELTLRLEESDGRGNYEVIAERASEAGRDRGEGEPEGEGRRFRIESLVLRDVTVHATWRGEDVTLLMEEIPLRDVGSETGAGAALSQVHGIVVAAILDAVVRNAGALLPEAIAVGLGESVVALAELGTYSVGTVGSVGRMVGGAIESIPVPGAGPAASILERGTEAATGVIEEATERAGEAVEDVLGTGGDDDGE